MMRPDNKGRSASPHRITYKSDFHAIKCSFDTGLSLQPRTKAAAAIQGSAVHPSMLLSSLTDSIVTSTSGSRGRIQSTRGTKLKENIFLQMDCQQSRQDGAPVLSSGSTPLLPPPNPSFQLHSSPFPRSRCTVISSSSVMSSVTSISSSETPLRGKPSRAEEMGDLDRVALAQRFSVARRLFETKMMEGGRGGGQALKPLTGRGSVEAAGGKTRCEEEDGPNKDKYINHILNVASLKPCLGASQTRYSKSPALNGPGDAHNGCDRTTDIPTQVETGDGATLNSCLASEETLRAELVNVKNESSESDENEEEKVWREVDTRWIESEMEVRTDKAEGKCGEGVLDDVFEETPGLLKSVELRAGEDGSVAPSQDMQRKQLAEDGGEGRSGKYQQVNEEWEEQSRHFTAQDKSVEERDDLEEKTPAGLGEGVVRLGRVLIQEMNADKEVEGKAKDEDGGDESRQCQNEARQEAKSGREKGTPGLITEEVKHVVCRGGGEGKDYTVEGKEDQMVISGIENKAFVYDQESRSHQELSGPLRREEESSPQRDDQLLVECEEIPGLPELEGQDEDESEAARRKVRFSTAPIKVYTMYSNADYNRCNEEIDPVSASAEFELEKRVERMDVFPVEIEKGEEGLGISIIGMGVGADQGLEKLGIFVKTITEGGATHKDGRIGVNDQIVEVDGVSLVGVSQLFAATVLKNTSGFVKFLIGREKEGVESEVARLINESLEMEKIKKSESQSSGDEGNSDGVSDRDSVFDEDEEGEDDEEDVSVLSSLENYQLCLKYQQLQSKLRSRTTRLHRSREKLKALEEQRAHWQSQKAELERRARDGEERADKLESYWQEAQTLCRVVSQRLADAQSQTESLENKYSKAKRLVKEYQSREEEREKALVDLRSDMEEKDKQHRETVERLQIQMAQLERKEADPERKNHFVSSSVTDWYVPVPVTGRLDSSAHIARAQLAQKSKRHPPSREKLRESFKKQEEVVLKQQDGQLLPTYTMVQNNRSDLSSTSSYPTFSPQSTTSSLPTPPVFISDTVTPSPCKSSASRKSKRKFPDFSGLRKSLGKKRSEKRSRRSTNSRGSCGDLIDEPAEVSPSGSVTSMPSCLPIPWFGERGRDKEKEAGENSRVRLRSVSSSSLPYLTTSRREQSIGSPVGCSSMVGHVSDHSLSGNSHTCTFSSSETLDNYPFPNNNNNQWQSRPVSEWKNQQVCLWLIDMNMDQYTSEFAAKGVDGSQLLSMDSQKLKALGVSSQSDRSVFKKKLKEIRREEKEQRKEDKRLKESEEKARRMSEKSMKDAGSSFKTIRTESLL
ncbi:neurabin-1-like isoform X2 [Kryptolebias marmoratus]|uniref:Neurabin-1 n=1 Tax=Kryptolebias marmoratus TaxID=37003 RepID=A0A3Q3FBU3_KRYMA|nr:neurabin-1-like isoform X2 [Kryptolebias marmoratus]